MTRQYPIRSELNFTTIILLALALASVCWISIRSIYTISHSAPALVVLASYLLSLGLLVLGGALLFQKPWSLSPLSLVGKGYFFLSVFLLLIRAENMMDISWLFTAGCIIYLASLNYLNPLRTYIGLDKVSGIFFAGRAAAAILLVGTCVTLYVVLISNLFPDYTYRISTRDYSNLVLGPDVDNTPAHTWSEQWKVIVPDDLIVLDTDIGIGIWSGADGEKVIVSPSVWSQQAEDYLFMGFKEPYEFDKAVWSAGIGQPFLLGLKMVMANEGTQAYNLEKPGIKAVIILNHLEQSSQPTWVANATIYPADGQPYTVDSASGSLNRAMLPIRMTLSRYLEGE